MPFLRRLLLLAVVGAGSALLASPALAVPRPGGAPYTLDSPNFRIHYQTDKTNTIFAIDQTTAGDVAARAERALAAELADGYPMPLSDGVLGGDGRIDIYVSDLSASGALGLTEWDVNGAAQTSAFIELAGDSPAKGLDQHTIAHELFHVIQLTIWLPAAGTDFWLLEGSAEWMGYRATGYSSDHPFAFGPGDMALDCRDPNFANFQCDLTDVYKNNGYSRWPFFEYVTETYGTSFIKDVFAQGAAGAASATAAIGAALATKGTTLADAYNAWTVADLTGAYSIKALQGRSIAPYGSPIQTDVKTGPVSTTKVAVNHLSTRVLEFDRGDGDDTHACYAATLSLTVTVPAGTLSKPVFWWNAEGNAPVPLSVSGSTAVASIPWDTCKWQQKGFLALPNASTNVDAADFVVSSALNVDKSQPVSATAPPPAATTNTPVINVSNADAAPTATVAGAIVIKLASKERVVRLLVESSGDGKLHGTIGGADLGSPTLRAGNNDIRFTLPESALSALRRSASNNVLTLTVISPQGTQTGLSITRRVVVAKPVKKIRAHR